MTILSRLLVVASAAILSLTSLPASAETALRGKQTGKIEWGVYVDPDGCMHWWSDGGIEGYMVSRLNPKTGKPVCLQKETCYVGPTDTLFATDSSALNRSALGKLKRVFTQKDVFGFAVYGHTDSRASHAYNQGLSERRAASVANYGRSLGAVIERQIGFGETRPRATNKTAAGMQKNRRVEIICYKW